jgi:hypothetical protein
MLQTRPNTVYENLYPQPIVLLPGQGVRFSDQFPDTLSHVRGKTFTISKAVEVRYELSWILPTLDYKDIDLSNSNSGEKLYPNQSDELYETVIGLKPGNYFVQVFFPANQPVYRLSWSTMYPDASNAALKYLGAVKPEDSPPDNPIFKIYSVFKLDPFYLRMVVDDGIDYEKMTLVLTINRCKLVEEPPEGSQPKYIPYITELQW